MSRASRVLSRLALGLLPLAALAAAPPPASAAGLECGDQEQGRTRCTRVVVPLDRSGAVEGRIGLSVRTIQLGLATELRGLEGGFLAALDADSEGVEGRFYVWTPEQIRAAPRRERRSAGRICSTSPARRRTSCAGASPSTAGCDGRGRIAAAARPAPTPRSSRITATCSRRSSHSTRPAATRPT